MMNLVVLNAIQLRIEFFNLQHLLNVYAILATMTMEEVMNYVKNVTILGNLFVFVFFI